MQKSVLLISVDEVDKHSARRRSPAKYFGRQHEFDSPLSPVAASRSPPRKSESVRPSVQMCDCCAVWVSGLNETTICIRIGRESVRALDMEIRKSIGGTKQQRTARSSIKFNLNILAAMRTITRSRDNLLALASPDEPAIPQLLHALLRRRARRDRLIDERTGLIDGDVVCRISLRTRADRLSPEPMSKFIRTDTPQAKQAIHQLRFPYSPQPTREALLVQAARRRGDVELRVSNY